MTLEFGAAGMEPSGPGRPLVELRSIGDGMGVARVLARVLVRRALITEGMIRAGEACEGDALTG